MRYMGYSNRAWGGRAKKGSPQADVALPHGLRN